MFLGKFVTYLAITNYSLEHKMLKYLKVGYYLQGRIRVDARYEIIQHYPPAPFHSLEGSHGRDLQDIDESVKNKAGNYGQRADGDQEKHKKNTGKLVYNDALRVFFARLFLHIAG